MTHKLSLIVAVADNNVIGKDNKMPWHISEDFKHFKEITTGKPCIMAVSYTHLTLPTKA